MITRCRHGMTMPYTLYTARPRLRILLGSLWLASALLTLSTAQAQQRELQLSLREATAFALQGNLEIQIAGLTPRIRAAQVTERQGIFDVTARATARATDTRTLETSTTFPREVKVVGEDGKRGIVGQDNSQEQRFAIGITQLTPYGGTYDAEIAETHLSTTRRTTGSDARCVFATDPCRNGFYTTETTVRATQPLLRNFGSAITKNQILIAQNNLTSSQEEFRRQVIAITSRVQQAYWDLVFRRQDLEVRRQQLTLAQRLLEQIRKQVAVGTLAPLEVLQAETNIARTEERILVADNALRAAEDRLKRILNYSLVGEYADAVLTPTDAPTYTDPVLQLDQQIQEALAHRPDLAQAKLTLENQHITLVFDKNQVLPTLDLDASLRFNGIDDRFGASFGEFDLRRRYRWEIGMTLRYPLGNRQAESRVQQSQLAIRQQLVRIKDLEEAIIADVRNAVRDVLTNSQRVQATRVSSRLATKQLEAEEKKLQVGLATVFTTLQFQDVLAVERSNEINALTEYLRALVRLEEAKSTLLRSYNIVLNQDGPRLP